jgi:8-oxo-dGTP diphosphatase
MKLEFSAGGVVFKKENGDVFVLIAQHSGHHGFVFPKGRIGDHIKNEGKEETAVREVLEETGAIGKIQKPIKPVTYYYLWKGKKIKKTVYFYTMEYISGDITKHDFEMENVMWVLKKDVLNKLTYSSDKKVWKEAIKLI